MIAHHHTEMSTCQVLGSLAPVMPIFPVVDPTPGERERCSGNRGRREQKFARYRNAIKRCGLAGLN